jgi:hypothetical protein
VLQRLVRSARTTVTSWSILDGEAELAASPLLEKLQIGLGSKSESADPGWHAASLQLSDDNMSLATDDAPALRDGEIVSGGAATIQAQSVDTFSAFARGRLGIRDIPRIEAGLPAAMKGNVAHKALHAMYSDKPDSTAIAGWDVGGITSRIDRATGNVFAAASRQLSPLHRRLLELERQRLHTILAGLVDAERTRPWFSVEFVEEQFVLQMHGIKLQLRIDRIDRLEDESLLILDYKTGRAKSLLNRDGEPNDLQLVVYAAAVAASQRRPIGGIAFVNVDSRSISYKGTGGSVSWDTKRRDDWDDRLSRWLDLVDTAMLQLAAGDVRVNLSQAATRARSLALLSRISELSSEL